MKRRYVLAALGLPAATPFAPAWAAEDSETPLVRAPRIVEVLNARDIVVDKPGATAQKPLAAPTGYVPQRPGAIDLQVQFTFGSAELRPHGKRQLDELAMALTHRFLKDTGFELAGHTDRVGGLAHNMRLSLDRAQAVKDYLVSAHGLAPTRLFPIGFGFSRLAVPERPEAAINRRVEVRRLRAPMTLPKLGGEIVPTPR